eukprot:CAMPEP_0119094542 /NCGR_PEP_ID=MMETSP1178-20130426/166493_1 /TAXON_ID=33656 /ORGANISM="unid sp, Strain CCMP2000" /LENGTH=34 /DNA_ID= /DNA_START= /DNA_END= /DNA_ORIENTATION=
MASRLPALDAMSTGRVKKALAWVGDGQLVCKGLG